MNKRFTIELNDNGIYLLNQCGGEGKSYLRKLVDDYSNYDARYMAVTYDSKQRAEDRLEQIDKFTGDILVLDRVDLYHSSDLIDLVLSKDIKVLVDLKDTKLWSEVPFKFAGIEMYPDGVLVKEI